MNTFAKFSTAFGAAAVSMAFVSGVALADTSAVNTGNNVTLNGGVSSTTNVNVSNSNSATILQSSSSDVNTGGNTANRNIGDTSVQTGSATVNNAFQAKANSNTTSVSGLGGQVSNDSTLTNTGDHVNLNAGSSNTTNATVVNSNSANVDQSAMSNVNTGDNNANRNIGDTSVRTGNANIGNVFGAQVNGNQTALSGLGAAGNCDNSLSLTNTGDHVNANGGCNNHTNLTVVNYNQASIDQMAGAFVNTGDNNANRNIGLNGAGASVMTGAANIGNLFSAEANGNVTGINGLGGSAQGVNSDVTNTGDHLVSNAGTHVVTNVTVSNANGAEVSQNTVNCVTTGDNAANRNIALDGLGSHIGSGNTALTSAFLAGANWNWTMIGGNAGMPSSWWMF